MKSRVKILEKLAGFNEKSWEKLKQLARPGDIVVHDHRYSDRFTGSAMRLGTGKPVGHIGLIADVPSKGRRLSMIDLMPGGVRDHNLIRDASDYGLTLLRPKNLSARQRQKAVKNALEAKKRKLVSYRDADNVALVPSQLIKLLSRNKDSYLASQAAKFTSGLDKTKRNCPGGNCAWFVNYAYNPKNPEAGAKALGLRPSSGLYSPSDFLRASGSGGSLERVYDYKPSSTSKATKQLASKKLFSMFF